MSLPASIILPGIITHLERFLRPLAATSGDGVEIRQDDFGTTVSVCEGRHAATITTRTAGKLEPVLVDPAALAGVDPSQPLKLYRFSQTSWAIVQASGELSNVTITPGTLQRSARDLADVVEGEIASGMTTAVFDVDTQHLLAVAEALVAIGCERVTIASAPRWNTLACIASTDEVSTVFMVAGEEANSDTEADDDDPLSFTIEGRRPSAKKGEGRRNGIDISGIPETEIPW